ncbi:MAG: PAS domain S-box protein, partial [Rubrivivax sp.]|nr:PAS domain S-box protein [Rubrivivax sp.]
ASLLHIDEAFKDIQAQRQGRGVPPTPGTGARNEWVADVLEHAAFIHAETRRVYVRAAESANQASARAEQSQARQSRAIYLLLGGTALILAALGLGFARRMARAVPVLRSGLQRYASGDLRSGLDLSGGDELSDIAQSASEMARQLEGVIAGERNARLEALRQSAARSSAEDQLRESEAQYRLLFEYNLDGVLLTRPDGRILRSNAEAQRILGYDEEQLRRLGRAALFDGHDPLVEAALAQRRRTGSYRGELIFCAAGGRRFPAEVSSVIFKDGGGQEMSSVIFRDVTEVRRAEQSLRESEARYRHLVDRSPLAISVHQDGVLVQVNDSALAMFGAHDDSEILGQPVSRF